MRKITLTSLCFLLISCSANLIWKDARWSKKECGPTFVEISLDGRDSAHVFVDDNGLFSRLKLDLKRGTHLYALNLTEGTYQFAALRFKLNGFFHDFASGKRDYPVIDNRSRKRALTNFYCSSWRTVPDRIQVLGKISFTIKDDDFYLKCDERDSTRLAIENYARKLYPKTFQFYQGE